MPEAAIAEHVEKVLTSPYLTGTEPIIVYPLRSKNFHLPLFIKPESETFYLLGVLYNTSLQAIPDFPFEDVLARNKALYLDAKLQGGCRYPIDAIPFAPEDWVAHFGNQWQNFLSLKQKYDPQHLLTTGFEIFH